ncbi:MAG: KUP/HAK/KT family potassium transporter [Microgenomates group bacterium]
MKALFGMSLAALGVVYGDIGTSPLYAVNEIFFGHARHELAKGDVFGVISIIFWVLTLIVAVKYISIVMNADSSGEGGVFSLYSLVKKTKVDNKFTKILITLFIIASGLLLGDGIITPAISVVSAVEGIKVITSSLSAYVVPITIVIITGLFMIQQFGTHKIGSLFGPIITVWFVSIGLIGLSHIVANPSILQALNPAYAFQFFMNHDIRTIFVVLGSVMLVITGGEAMYADMGHFGKKPIRISWFSLVYPALVMNYFGQGAYMISGKTIVANNIFYSMVPKTLLFPMVILATLATIIASQALISGAFSLISQAISLGLLPFVKVIHTHKDHHGQIYIPSVNWMLYIGAVTLVLLFQSSSRLASIYGLAVSGDMFITSLAMIAVSHYLWKWSLPKSLLIFVPLALIDFSFLSSNSLKLLEGGYIPLSISILVLLVIQSWQWGRSFVGKEYDSYKRGKISDLMKMKHDKTYPEIPKSYIFMTPRKRSELDDMPTLMQIFIDRYGALPKHIIFLTVRIEKTPFVEKTSRYSITNFGAVGWEHDTLASVIVRFGFMEDPNVENVLQDLANHHEILIDTDKHKWLIEVMHERVYVNNVQGFFDRLKASVFMFISQFADTADHYFKLGDSEPLAIEVVPVKLK